MDIKVQSFENYSKVKSLCLKVIQNPKNIECIKELNAIIQHSPKSFIKVVQPTVLSTFYPILKNISGNKSSFKDDDKQLIVDTLKNLFEKSTTDKLVLFFNIYSFLLLEIYDHQQHVVLAIHEEYKLSIMNCMISLMKSVSSDFVFSLYTRQNAPKFCQMLYTALELAKNEQLKSLRVSAMECIMAIAKVLDDSDFDDVELRNQVAEVFLFFLPGIASGLTRIALEDEKVGHKIPMVALKAWGRIITLLMANYNSADDDKFDLSNLKNILNKNVPISGTEKRKKFKNEKEIKEYLHINKRTVLWYKDTDKRLQPLIIEFAQLTHHSHHKVRLELTNMIELIIENCFKTMPTSVSHLIELTIILSEDEHDGVKEKSNEILQKLSNQLSSDNFKTLLENLEEGFYNGINSLPRKFNGIDEKEQLASLNLIIGYLKLFGKHNLSQILLSATHLNKLMNTLIHISELEKSNVSLLEEYSTKELELNPDLKTPWKNFRHFKEDSIKIQLEYLCALLAKYGGFEIISDFLLDIIMFHSENRKEAIYILNEAIMGVSLNSIGENIQTIRNIVATYTDNGYWEIPLSVVVDEFGYAITLADVQHNVFQVCLLVEGIGKIALVLQRNFQEFLLKTLYLVLERAGSGHPLVKAAGLSALSNITLACGYSNITSLINNNIDYFTYHVERKLNKLENNEGVLNVLAVVLNYSTVDVLVYIADIIKEVLLQSCDKFKERNAIAFLEIFKIFIRCLRVWYNVVKTVEPVKSKKQKLKEIENFQVMGVGIKKEENFSDEIMGKSAEDMYKEDMKKKQEEIEEPEIEEYKKPEPPLHIKLTVAVLSRSLHFLPSKDKTKKLLALNILLDGLDILKDFEDELLPMVHQIWSPLVQRFREFDNPIIINYSFLLLATLARLSKEFIRMRTTKEVLPSILLALKKFSEESYLKDRGSAYRYSQTYKLQLAILENLGNVLIHLDVSDEKLTEVMDTVIKYLSNKQPIPLQVAAMDFFKILALYDLDPVKSKFELWQKENIENEFENNVSNILGEIMLHSN